MCCGVHPTASGCSPRNFRVGLLTIAEGNDAARHRDERASVRQLYSIAGLCVLALSLTGCGAEDPEPSETAISMPTRPTPTSDASAPTATPTRSPDATAPTDQNASADPADPSEHCVMVAGGVTTAMLAPLSFRSEVNHDQLVALRQQILDFREKVPADLHDEFTVLADSVEAPPEGSGKFDEHAFRQAMEPVEEWLGKHCART